MNVKDGFQKTIIRKLFKFFTIKINHILTVDLGMIKVAAKFVLKQLSGGQKENRKQIITDLLQYVESDENFLN